MSILVVRKKEESEEVGDHDHDKGEMIFIWFFVAD